MNRLEDRLRDAFAAAAETVQREPVGVLRVRSRQVRTRRLAPLVAAAAVAVVIIGASVITPLALVGGHRAPSAPGGAREPKPSASASGPSASAVAVPQAVGMPIAQAEVVLTAAGLVVTVQAQAATSSAPAGTVITQIPVGGARVAAGTVIILTIAVGSGSSPTPAPRATG